MPTSLADARRSLHRAKEAAIKRLEELANETREVKASLKSLDAALKALGRSSRTRQAECEPSDSELPNHAGP